MEEDKPRAYDGEIIDLFSQLLTAVDSVEAWLVSKSVESSKQWFLPTARHLIKEIQGKIYSKVQELRKIIEDLNEIINDRLDDSSDGAGS